MEPPQIAIPWVYYHSISCSYSHLIFIPMIITVVLPIVVARCAVGTFSPDAVLESEVRPTVTEMCPGGPGGTLGSGEKRWLFHLDLWEI